MGVRITMYSTKQLRITINHHNLFGFIDLISLFDDIPMEPKIKSNSE